MKKIILGIILLLLVCNGILFASYKIDRLEIVKNREGINELFISISITDELGQYNFAKWLTQEEFNIYKNDNSKINKIIENYLPLAKQNKLNEIEYLKK